MSEKPILIPNWKNYFPGGDCSKEYRDGYLAAIQDIFSGQLRFTETTEILRNQDKSVFSSDESSSTSFSSLTDEEKKKRVIEYCNSSSCSICFLRNNCPFHEKEGAKNSFLLSEEEINDKCVEAYNHLKNIMEE